MKSHLTFTKQQRSGIFIFLLLIIAFQCIYFFVDFTEGNIYLDEDEISKFEREIDSLRLVEHQKNKPIIYPFNPNYITDYKGYTLGMSNEEIDRLLSFRAQDKWVNSAQEFQNVTKVSDSFLAIISPYFQFPEWITNPKSGTSNYKIKNFESKTFAQKQDLNSATAEQLQKINGIGEALSDRIIKYRNKFNGGFIADIQLQDVYGLSPEVIERILNEFTVKTPRAIEKLNLNTATANQLVTIQYIDYEIAHHIIERRTLIEGYKSLDDLLKVKNFPVNKIEIIKLYLTLE
ncbi:competence ComEA-like helix-hairpin-helix protein [Flavobacteriaceae bacterium MAR_2010_72]|nr:competence ComEA-like helix-hairpin-helix protein [Flavobacteriaceae bacterium MAR_2010_72]TVZ59024.1 competence ComEA-like helix-hairpin-helix protein [Flavobacteriaceae bacterium MAR_2010_105]